MANREVLKLARIKIQFPSKEVPVKLKTSILAETIEAREISSVGCRKELFTENSLPSKNFSEEWGQNKAIFRKTTEITHQL